MKKFPLRGGTTEREIEGIRGEREDETRSQGKFLPLLKRASSSSSHMLRPPAFIKSDNNGRAGREEEREHLLQTQTLYNSLHGESESRCMKYYVV